MLFSFRLVVGPLSPTAPLHGLQAVAEEEQEVVDVLLGGAGVLHVACGGAEFEDF